MVKGRMGNMKCFNCRAVCMRTDGNWHEGENDQVYLCKSCGQTHQASLLATKARLTTDPTYKLD
jgi:hypothetical protein